MMTDTSQIDDTAVRGLGDSVKVGNGGLGLGVLAAACGLVGARGTDSAAVDGYGLIGALPLLYWIGILLAVAATYLLLRAAATNEHSRYAAVVPFLWLVLLHTAPQLAHAHARLPAAWGELGLIRLIDETGSADLALDGRLAWPGFHATFVAPLARMDGWAIDALLRLWPSWITGGTAVLVGVLARRAYPSIPLIGSLSALLHVLLAWTGRDYFSSLSMGFIWFVAILVVLESGPLRTGSAWSAAVPLLPRFAVSGGDRPASRSTAVFVVLVVLGLAAVVTHPLAPLFICCALLILGIYGRSLAWRLLLLVGVAYLVWWAVTGEPWWTTGDPGLVDPFGGIADSASTAATDGLGNTAERTLVVRLRTYLAIGIFAAVPAIGVAMATERYRHLRPSLPLVPLAAVPAALVMVTGRNGETVARVLAFTLPVASILLARMLAALRVRSLPVAGTLAAVALCPLLLVARFGDERFEMTTEQDRAAVEAAYERADDDTLFVADVPLAPWRDRTLGDNVFTEERVEATDEWIDRVEATAAEAGKDRIIVVLTDGQAGWIVNGEGGDVGDLDEFADWLLARPGSELVFHEERSWAIEL